MQWERLEPTDVKKAGRRTIVRKTFRLPDGTVETFDTKEREGWAGVATVALTEEGNVLIFRLFRPGPERLMDELPGGVVDLVASGPEGLSESQLMQEAARELEEETGHSGRMRYLGSMSYDAYTNGWRHAFLAEDCTPTENGQHLDVEERGAALLEITPAQLIDNALRGRMTDPGAVMLAAEIMGWPMQRIEQD